MSNSDDGKAQPEGTLRSGMSSSNAPVFLEQGNQHVQFPARYPYTPRPLYYYTQPIAPTHSRPSMYRQPLPAFIGLNGVSWPIYGAPPPAVNGQYYGGPWPVYRPPLPTPSPPLPFRILKQIEFYFSIENLVKDVYLRKYMDAQGWVPMELVANFPMVKNLAKNTEFEDLNNIMKLMGSSVQVEVKDLKIRKKHEWEKWILPNSPHAPAQAQPTTLCSNASLQPASEGRGSTNH